MMMGRLALYWTVISWVVFCAMILWIIFKIG